MDAREAVVGAIGAAHVVANMLNPTPLADRLVGDLADHHQNVIEQRARVEEFRANWERRSPGTEQHPR